MHLLRDEEKKGLEDFKVSFDRGGLLSLFPLGKSKCFLANEAKERRGEQILFQPVKKSS